MRCHAVFFLVSLVGLIGAVRTVRGQFAPVYGSPGYTPGAGGYTVTLGLVDLNNRIAVNNSGTAVATADRVDGAGTPVDRRAVRWSAGSAVELEHLGTSDGLAYSAALAINDAGVAVGSTYNAATSASNVRWNGLGTAATAVQLPNGAEAGQLTDINNAGQFVGHVYQANLPRPVRWDSNGVPTLLPLPAGFNAAEIYEINEAGISLGRAFDGLTDRAVRWDAAGNATELGHLGLDANGYTILQPLAINAAGAAVGYAYKHDEWGEYLGTVPVRWNAGAPAAVELETLDPQPGGPRFGGATAINDTGDAVGSVLLNPSMPGDDFGTRAARWDAGGAAVTQLGDLGSAPNGESYANAHAINSAGVIVGTATRYNAEADMLESRAVYWQGGTAVDLNSHIHPASGWTLTNAYDVSDTGWIAGDGFFDPDGAGGQEPYGRYFVLKLPAPTGGDFDGDGAVDALDLAIWKDGFGATGAAAHTDGDADGDLDVDGADFLIWQRQFTGTSSVSTSAAVPEPTAVAAAACGLSCLLAAGRRRASWRYRQDLAGRRSSPIA